MYSNVGNAVNKCGSTARLGPLQGLTRRMWKPVAILDVSVSQLCAQVALDKIHKGWRCSTWAPLNGQSFASPASLRYLQPARAVGHPRELPAIRTVVWELKKKKNLHISTLSYYPTMRNFRQSERGPGAGRVIIQPPSPRIDTQNHALHSEQCTICGISPGHWKNLENAQEIPQKALEILLTLLPVAACCLFILGHIAFLALSFKETEKSEPFIRKDPRELRRVLSPAATTLTLSNSPLGYPLPQGHEHHQAFCKKQPSWTFWYCYDCVARLANGIIGYNRHW